MPVSGSIAASLRCSRSERISATESAITETISVSVMIVGTGSVDDRAGVDAERDERAAATIVSVPPATTPRGPKRAGSVTVGIASHGSARLSGPPVSAMLTAMSVWESTQAQAIRYSGRASLLEVAAQDDEADERERERRQRPPADPRRRWRSGRRRSPRSRGAAPGPGAAPCRACARGRAAWGRATWL